MGVLAATLGAGIGFACFGYSYVTDGRAQAQKMADAMVQALEKAQFTATGTVKLADGSTVGFALGDQVMLAPNSTVRRPGLGPLDDLSGREGDFQRQSRRGKPCSNGPTMSID
jgi:hypothetical protein